VVCKIEGDGDWGRVECSGRDWKLTCLMTDYAEREKRNHVGSLCTVM
jgi:hypothetical protein